MFMEALDIERCQSYKIANSFIVLVQNLETGFLWMTSGNMAYNFYVILC